MRRRYRSQRIGQTPDKNKSKVSNVGSGTNRSNATLFFTIFVLALSTVVFILVLNKRIGDQSARDIVRAENLFLDQAIANLHQSLILEESILFQKNVSLMLEPEYAMLKMWINGNTLKIQSIDDLNGLASMVNNTILNITTGYNTQITNLENTLQELLSVSSQTNGNVVKSGICSLVGTTSLFVTYFYKKLTISGLDYYYYVLGSTNGATVTMDNNGISIQNCLPPIYEGPLGEISPVFTKQLESFIGDGVNEIIGIQAGLNKVDFKTTAFIGTKQIGISDEELTHFVSFF